MQYNHAPIIEAVIEIRFDDFVEFDDMKKLFTFFSKQYPQPEIQRSITFKVPNHGTNEIPEKVEETTAGYRFRTSDQTEVITIMKNVFAFSRLAPYENWEAFINRFKEEWGIFTKFTGRRQINRMGLRYINRIDIPSPDSGLITVEDYLKIYPQIDATEFGNIGHYAIQLVYAEQEAGYSLTLNSGPVPSPLVEHASFLLDLDLGKETNLPQRDDVMWEQLEKMRDVKNRKFESLVTDKARELFNS